MPIMPFEGWHRMFGTTFYWGFCHFYVANRVHFTTTNLNSQSNGGCCHHKHLGLVLEMAPGELCFIHHLSSSKCSSINDAQDPWLGTVSFTSLDAAVAWMAWAGIESLIGKMLCRIGHLAPSGTPCWDGCGLHLRGCFSITIRLWMFYQRFRMVFNIQV